MRLVLFGTSLDYDLVLYGITFTSFMLNVMTFVRYCRLMQKIEKMRRQVIKELNQKNRT